MDYKASLCKSTADNGNIVYNLNPLLEDMNHYQACRVALADLLEIPEEKVPLQHEELEECLTNLLTAELPERVQDQFVGLEYMGKYQLCIHNDGTMVVKVLDDSEEV